jgi:hypothetical protein
MRAAGYVLTGMRKYRRRAHPPMILAHSLTSEFFGIEGLDARFAQNRTLTGHANGDCLWRGL